MDWWFRLALVVHVGGILWLMSAITLELFGTIILRQAMTVESIRSAAAILKKLPKFFGPSSAVILLSGLYLSWVRLDHHLSIGWVVVSLVAFVLMSGSGSTIGKRTSKALKTELQKNKGTMTDRLRELSREAVGLRQGLVGLCVVLGLVAVMIYKPGAVAAIITLLAAAAIGLALAGRAARL